MEMFILTVFIGLASAAFGLVKLCEILREQGK